MQTLDIDHLRAIAINAQRAWETLCKAHGHDICDDCGGIIAGGLAACIHNIPFAERCRECEELEEADIDNDGDGDCDCDSCTSDCNSCSCPPHHREHCCGDYNCPLDHAKIDAATSAYIQAMTPAVALDVIQMLDMAIARATNKMGTDDNSIPAPTKTP